MNAQVNWQKIRAELQRLADVDRLKNEVQRIGTEIRNFDFHTVLTPNAQTKVKKFEKRYGDVMRTIQQAQRQMDREFNRIMRQIKGHRSDMKKTVSDQKDRLEKASDQFKKRVSAKMASASKAKKSAGPKVRVAKRKPARKKA